MNCPFAAACERTDFLCLCKRTELKLSSQTGVEVQVVAVTPHPCVPQLIRPPPAALCEQGVQLCARGCRGAPGARGSRLV